MDNLYWIALAAVLLLATAEPMVESDGQAHASVALARLGVEMR